MGDYRHCSPAVEGVPPAAPAPAAAEAGGDAAEAVPTAGDNAPSDVPVLMNMDEEKAESEKSEEKKGKKKADRGKRPATEPATSQGVAKRASTRIQQTATGRKDPGPSQQSTNSTGLQTRVKLKFPDPVHRVTRQRSASQTTSATTTSPTKRQRKN